MSLPTNPIKKYVVPFLVICLLVIPALALTGCEGFDFAPAEDTPPATEEAVEPSTIRINTEEGAILAFQEHLFSLAQSHQAKLYLADYYAATDGGQAKSELFQDGTLVWYVTLKAMNLEILSTRPEWQEAVWLVFQDGKAIPSDRAEANALRVEAALQELSPTS